MRITLINPRLKTWSPNVYPPLGLCYIAASLENAGHDVDILDMNSQRVPDKALVEHIEQSPLVGIGGLVTEYNEVVRLVKVIKTADEDKIVILGGPLATTHSEELLATSGADVAVIGEGEQTIVELVKGIEEGSSKELIKGIVYQDDGKIHTHPLREPETNLDNILHPARHLLDMGRYSTHHFKTFGIKVPKMKSTTMITSRGCPYHCLQGDTLIDTLDGLTPIKELVGRSTKVLTRNLQTGTPEYALASMVMQTGTNRELVRVSFDDGSHIDCTPDHRFKVFKNGNQHASTIEWDTEARDLKKGQSVRAIKYQINPKSGYVDIVWGRRLRQKQHRLVLEGYLGRKLEKGEQPHHTDNNRANNIASNLRLVSTKEHLSQYHPNVAQRMRQHNPMFDKVVKQRMSTTTKERIANGSIVPFMCTPEGKKVISHLARIRALSDQNPAKVRQRERIAEINHKVVSIQKLLGRHDTYCMEVPGHDWFYANGILVHNCSFCDRNTAGLKWRARSPEDIVKEMQELREDYDVRGFVFNDDTFVVNRKRVLDFCGLLEKELPDAVWYCNGRVNLMDEEMIQAMAKSGCAGIAYGIESGNQGILDSVHKQITLEQVERIVALTKKYGIHVTGYWMIGILGDTKETIRETIAFAEKLDLDFYGWGITSPIPGTEMYTKAVEMGLVDTNKKLEDWSFHAQMNLSKDCSYEELEALNEYAFRHFTIEKRWGKRYLLNPQLYWEGLRTLVFLARKRNVSELLRKVVVLLKK